MLQISLSRNPQKREIVDTLCTPHWHFGSVTSKKVVYHLCRENLHLLLIYNIVRTITAIERGYYKPLERVLYQSLLSTFAASRVWYESVTVCAHFNTMCVHNFAFLGIST